MTFLLLPFNPCYLFELEYNNDCEIFHTVLYLIKKSEIGIFQKFKYNPFTVSSKKIFIWV